LTAEKTGGASIISYNLQLHDGIEWRDVVGSEEEPYLLNNVVVTEMVVPGQAY